MVQISCYVARDTCKDKQYEEYFVFCPYSYLVRPSSLSPQASPLIDERRVQRMAMKREEPPGAEKNRDSTQPFANNNEVRRILSQHPASKC